MFNKAILIGRLTADPELKQTPSGVYVSSFTVACNRRFTSKDSERKADFIGVVTWRQQAEFVCKYFHKGDAIGIEGSIQTRNYDDKNGVKHYVTEISADNVFFVGGKSSSQQSGGIPVTNDFSDYSPVAPASHAAPAAQTAPTMTAPTAQYSNGSLNDFEESDGDDDIPF